MEFGFMDIYWENERRRGIGNMDIWIREYKRKKKGMEYG